MIPKILFRDGKISGSLISVMYHYLLRGYIGFIGFVGM